MLGNQLFRHGVRLLGSRNFQYRSAWNKGALLTIPSLFLLSCYTVLNEQKQDLTTVHVDNSISDFPKVISSPHFNVETPFTLLGAGQRFVTFLNFKVYCLGLYVAVEDLPTLKETLSPTYLSKYYFDVDNAKSHGDNLNNALNDPKQSQLIIDDLLEQSAVRLLAKVTPVRTNNFKHLKDGFIHTINKHPKAKDTPDLQNGLKEMDTQLHTFDGMQVHKNDDLTIELLPNKSCKFTYYNNLNPDTEPLELGVIVNEYIGKYLFGMYLNDTNCPSPIARANSVTTICDLVNDSK